jgi:hypothetical protein
MLVALAIALVVGWVILKLAVGVTSLAIHVLLAAAVVFLVLHFLKGATGRGADVT